MFSKDIKTLEQALGYEFRKTELITEALTHRSFVHENENCLDNERMEFLGDAVLELCVAETVMKLMPEATEGQLSKLKSQLVSETALAKVARDLDLGTKIRLGKGEKQSGGSQRDSLLADAMEAVFAAIYLDGGLDEARKCILKLMPIGGAESATWVREKALLQDHKSHLQEVLQQSGYEAPIYKCLKLDGPEHRRRFVMGIFMHEREIVRAHGASKKNATQKAAQQFMTEWQSSGKSLIEYIQSFGVKSLRKPKRQKEINI